MPLSMSGLDITFVTACFYKDWEFLLKTEYLNQMITRCQVPFKSRWLLINNVDDLELVKWYAQRKVAQGVIDAYFVTADYIDKALDFFGLSRESFRGEAGGDGYYYSIADFVALYLCQTRYLLAFTGDAILQKGAHQWIQKACRIMDVKPEYVVANPTWNQDYIGAREESLGRMEEDFFVGYGFSDQCYLVRSADFRAKIYGFRHPDSTRYPIYGGEAFEKRVDAWMRCMGFLRLTCANESYLHRDFPTASWKRLWWFLKFRLGMY